MSWLGRVLLVLAPLAAQGKLVHLEAPPLVRHCPRPTPPFSAADGCLSVGLPQGWNSFLFGNGGPQYAVPNTTEVLGQGQLLDGFVANLLPAGYEYFGQ